MCLFVPCSRLDAVAVHPLEHLGRMGPARRLVQIQGPRDLADRYRLVNGIGLGKHGADGEVERVGIVDRERDTCREGTAVSVCRVADKDNAALECPGIEGSTGNVGVPAQCVFGNTLDDLRNGRVKVRKDSTDVVDLGRGVPDNVLVLGRRVVLVDVVAAGDAKPIRSCWLADPLCSSRYAVNIPILVPKNQACGLCC